MKPDTSAVIGPFKQTERQFQAQVIRYAELMGWRWYWAWQSMHSPAGFPDLVLVRARHRSPRVVFAELKGQRTKVTDDQRAWLAELRACGVEAFLWRPSMWEEIEQCLR